MQISYLAAAQDNGDFFFPRYISAPFGFSRSSAPALDAAFVYGFGIISKAEIDFPFLLCTVFRVSVALRCRALPDFPRLCLLYIQIIWLRAKGDGAWHLFSHKWKLAFHVFPFAAPHLALLR